MADAPAEKKGGKSGGSPLVPALLALNSILVAAVLALFLLRGGGGHAAAAEKGGEHGDVKGEKGEKGGDKPGPTVKLPDFVVHLRNPEADRYARVSFEVEVATEPEKEAFGAYLPRIRDGFIAYLSDRTLEELRGSEAIARLKSALEQRMPELAPGVKIKSLYITDLVIQ